MEKDQAESLIVNGFRFETEQEAKQAALEYRKIQYLETKIDYGDLRKVQAIYEKAVRENVFQTAPGLFYLKGLRDFLVREDARYEGVLAPVAFSKTATPAKETEEGKAGEKVNSDPGAAKTKTAEEKRREKLTQTIEANKTRLRVSILANVMLVIAVIAMFWIALNTEQPNILNYEKALTNRYAAWEQELTQREQEIRRMELQQRAEGID